MQQDLNKLLEIASESEDGTRNASADHGVPCPLLGLKGRINRARYFWIKISISEIIPFDRGRLSLGTWQGVFLWEHRARPHTREIVLSIQGAAAE